MFSPPLQQAALECKDVSPRTPAYQKFAAWLKENPVKNAEYKNIKAGPGTSNTNQLKKNFRLQWAEMQLEENTLTKTKKEEWQEVDIEIGTYESVDRMIWLEGGTLAAETAVMTYVNKAICFGGPWLSWNPMTERTDVLYVKKQYKKTFSRLWSLYCEQQQQLTAQLPAAATAPAASPSQVPTPSKVEVPPKPSKRGVVSENGAQDDKEKAAKKAKLDLFRKAATTKGLYLTLRGAQAQLLHSISGDDAYAWANNPDTLNRLKDAEAQVTKFVEGCPCNQFCIVHDAAEVRKVHGDSPDLHRHLSRFVTELQSSLEGLQREQRRFNRMHVANRSTA